MRKSLLVSLLVVGSSPAFFAVGCADSFKDCANTSSCPPEGDGDGDIGTGGTGTGDGDGDTGGSSVGGEGGEASVSSCDPACADDEVCDEDAGECVGCLEDDDCGEGEVCDPDNDVCVGCVEDADCADPTTPICDANECVGCSDDESCGDLGNRCLGTGECVECTPETDDRTVDTDDCGTGVCDPSDNSCREDLTQGAKDACMSCVADSECAADHNCVPLSYDPEGADEVVLGGFCMKLFATGCARPYGAGDETRTSLSGVETTYCGILESETTCESILLLDDDDPCSVDAQCGSEHGEGRCENVNGLGDQCTYSCTGNSQCETGYDCGGTMDDEYCGG